MTDAVIPLVGHMGVSAQQQRGIGKLIVQFPLQGGKLRFDIRRHDLSARRNRAWRARGF
jgi:hypothetical protein